jgi:hypothetical protein
MLGCVERLDLASSGLFFVWTASGSIDDTTISPASPSLPDEEPLALGPTTEFSDKAWPYQK